jgi:hypothetical protein
MAFELPQRGFVFWPVGTGDSSTIVVDRRAVVIQIDLHELECSEEGDDPHVSVIDELVRLLPRQDRIPFLSAFILTHPDRDHVQGFAELLSKVAIGEIWHTPRVFTEYKKDLCEDAKAFRVEVERRRKVTIRNHGEVASGDRVRVIGHDDIFQEDAYRNFPDRWRSYPGSSLTTVDGVDQTGVFEAFIHAPFKDDADGERNETCLALHIALTTGKQSGSGLFFGDHCYPTVRRIFDKTKQKKRTRYLEWDVMLAAHHCSKAVMYWQDDPEKGEVFKRDIMDDFEEAARAGAYVIASSESDFSDKEGKNPPHLKARKRYEEIIEAGHFLCTQEHPNTAKPEPIKFEVSEAGFTYVNPAEGKKAERASRVAVAVTQARGSGVPPRSQVGLSTSMQRR